MNDELIDAIRLALANQKGDELMEVLQRHYVDRLSYQEGFDPEMVAFREGERSIVLLFKTILEDSEDE